MIENVEIEIKKIATLYEMWCKAADVSVQLAVLASKEKEVAEEQKVNLLSEIWLEKIYFPLQESLLKKVSS